jgi:PPM family protein phosphatase
MVNEQQLNSTVYCSQCGFMFAVRAKPAAAPARPAGGSGVRPIPQNVSAAARQAAPPPPASSEEDDIMPGWDEAEIAARLASVQIPPASAPMATPMATPQASPPGTVTMPAPAASVRLDIGASTSSGRVRNRNEDSFAVHQLRWSNRNQGQDVALAVVADGMGGYDAGDVASGMAIQSLIGAMGATVSHAISAQGPAPNLSQALDSGIRLANQNVHRRATSDSQCRGMGSTLAAVAIWNGNAAIAHVGDCRVYHYRGGLRQVTEDHTLLQRMLQLGQISPQEAANPHHPARSEVAQAVGRQPDVSPSSQQLRLASGDWLVIACDGLHAHVDARALDGAIRSASSASALAIQLVNMANQGGGSDNITVVAIRCY